MATSSLGHAKDATKDDVHKGLNDKVSAEQENEIPDRLSMKFLTSELNAEIHKGSSQKQPLSVRQETVSHKGLKQKTPLSDREEAEGDEGLNRYCPLSPRQERMYFMQMANPDSRAFNLGLCLHLTCKKSQDIFPCELIPSAIKTLIERHPHLRSSINHSFSSIYLGQLFKDTQELEMCSVKDLSISGCMPRDQHNLESSAGTMKIASSDTSTESLSYASLDLVGSSSVPKYDTSHTNKSDCYMHKGIQGLDIAKLARDEVFKPLDLSKQPFRCTLYKISPREVALIVTFHHVIMDGTSLYIVTRDLLNLLNGGMLLKPKPNKDPRLTGSTADSKVERNLDSKTQRKLSKWISLLSSAKQCTSFTKHTSQSTDVNVSKHAYLPISESTFDALKVISEIAQVSSVVVLSSMFTCALAKFTSTDDIIIGMVSSNRGRDSKDVVNYFANTLPLRVNFSEDGHARTLSELLKHVKRNWSMVLDGALDLVDLLPHIPCLKRRGSISESPLQVLFSYYNVTEGNSLPVEVTVGGVEMTCHTHSPKPGHTHTDLVLEVDPTKKSDFGCQLFTWEYRKSVLSLTQVENLHQLTCKFIQATYKAYRNDRVDVSPLSMAPDHTPFVQESLTTSLSLVRDESNAVSSSTSPNSVGTALSIAAGPTFVNPDSLTANGRPLCFIQRFEKVAMEYPNFSAFLFSNGDTLTYYQVDILATKIALTLFSKGMRSGDHVGVHMTRTPWLYIVILGILKCAATYVPIDVNDTKERALKILQLAEIRLLVTESDLVDRFDDFQSTIVEFDSTVYVSLLQELQNSGSVFKEFSELKVSYDPERTCYILFTSGTTGEPKGVAISERNLHATLNNIQYLFTPEDTQVTLAAANVSFDGHVADAIGPIVNHACLVIAESILDLSNPEKIKQNPSLLTVTYTFATPSSASVVTFPESMRAIIVGGEVFSRACFENTLHIPKVVNGYGPTECTAFVSTNHLPRIDELQKDRPISDEEIASVGVPAPNVKLMVFNEESKPVPIGTTGILYVSGPTLSSTGYCGRPDLTKKAFFSNPHPSCDPAVRSCELGTKSCDQDEIVYCTGDYVKMLPNGKLQFLGRKDDQVKLRGVRFQLLEVEHALSTCPYITSKVVFIKNQGTPSAQLIACVTPASVDIQKVQQFASEVLPKYMLPSLIVGFDEFPLTKTGKVDKKVLEKLIQESSKEGPQTEHEADTQSDRIPQDKQIEYLQEDKSRDTVNTEQLDYISSVEKMATTLARVFGKVLGLPSYTSQDEFFANGGHSLLTFQLLREINREVELTLNLSHVLQYTTPLQLARVVVDMREKREFNDQGECLEIGHKKKDNLVCVHETTQSNKDLVHSDEDRQSVRPAPINTSPNNSNQPIFDYLSPVPDVPLPEELQTKLQKLFQKDNTSSIEASEMADNLAMVSGYTIPAQSLTHYSSLGMLQNHLKLKTIVNFKSQPHQVSAVVLVPRQSTDESPLFFIHAGIIGWALPYRGLAQSMGTYCIAIQHTAEAPMSSFEEMAGYYLKQMQEFQSHGPYELVGVCYGALLVYEIARQLSDCGEHVQLALMINNSPCYETFPPIVTPEGFPLQLDSIIHPYNFYEASLGLDFSTDESLNHFNKTGATCEDIVSALLTTFPWLPFSTQELVDAYRQFFLPVRAAWSGSYKPKSLVGECFGRVVLVRNPTHPFFVSHDFGLLRLVPQELLSVIVCRDRLGILSDKKTMNYITNIIKLFLMD